DLFQWHLRAVGRDHHAVENRGRGAARAQAAVLLGEPVFRAGELPIKLLEIVIGHDEADYIRSATCSRSGLTRAPISAMYLRARYTGGNFCGVCESAASSDERNVMIAPKSRRSSSPFSRSGFSMSRRFAGGALRNAAASTTPSSSPSSESICARERIVGKSA